MLAIKNAEQAKLNLENNETQLNKDAEVFIILLCEFNDILCAHAIDLIWSKDT